MRARPRVLCLALTVLVFVACRRSGEFDPQWRACAAHADCMVISTYCGGYASVAVVSAEAASKLYQAIAAIKNCGPPRASPPPVASCAAGVCQPDPVFPR